MPSAAKRMPPGGAEWLVLDDEPELHVAEPVVGEVLRERVGEVAERQHDLVDTVRAEPRELAFDERDVRDGQERLGRRERQRTETGAFPADEHDRFHGVEPVEPEGTVVEGAPVAPVAPVDPVPPVAPGTVEVTPGFAGWPPRSLMFASASCAPGGSGSG